MSYALVSNEWERRSEGEAKRQKKDESHVWKSVKDELKPTVRIEKKD